MTDGFVPKPRVYAANGDHEYLNMDVYGFTVDPKSGDIYLSYLHTGIKCEVRIFAADWDSFYRTINEEHAAIKKVAEHAT